jgi:hypothetical protein
MVLYRIGKVTQKETKSMDEIRDFQAVDNIINLICVLHKEESRHPYTMTHGGAKYLLNQTIRQLWLPASRRLLSIEAEQLFNRLGYDEEELFTFFYRMQVINKSDEAVSVSLYKGASSKPYEANKLLKPKESFLLREVFHDDHIIPITHVIEKLLTITEPNRETVLDVLKDVGVCRMLKGEDRKVTRTKRTYDEKFIIENLYYETGIRIKNYQYPE